MKIYTVCIDPERGIYLAVSNEDHKLRAVSYTSHDAAVGILVTNNPGLNVEAVHTIETDSLK